MRKRILTVDDSKTVRIIVRKAFKSFDCEILEAASGVEGLALAAREMPDLILLDVTMPVMDGIEMLTKLKADPKLKGIPVMMLTAEGGRDNVLKIAKIGVRDYIVKPFKEDVLVEKAGRIIELKSLADATLKPLSIFDAAGLLVIEDKPAIVQQIADGLKHTPWKVHGVATQDAALASCNERAPDLIIMSLSLPNDAAFNIFRLIRANPKTKSTPIFGLVVKTETVPQQRAQSVGMATIITKPIDLGDLEMKITKALNLDTSARYFSLEEGCLILRVPPSCPQLIFTEIGANIKPKMAAAVDAGLSKAIVDVHLIKSLDMGLIKLLVQSMQTSRELGINFALVGNAQIVAECKGFEDTRAWSFFGSIDEAKAHFGAATVPAHAAVS
ncbi:MAG: response regulator [Candidatus Didemnitutus sp.]|nr:response regulator [Candidatus Didemnitutus sp.]